MTAYYNEIDPYAAQWLRNLIVAGHIAPGYVDERSIEDVYPSDLAGFTQCHFFGGIGVWSLALRNAGWPDDRPVWTGSCPCQPFSAAGKGVGFNDERHMWPAFHHLIKERRPSTVFGEQVASKDADAWIDLVHTDMEALGYAFGAIPFPSASVGAPHIRDRMYWVADSTSQGLAKRQWISRIPGRKAQPDTRQAVIGSGIHDTVGLANTPSLRCRSGGEGAKAQAGWQQRSYAGGELAAGFEGCALLNCISPTLQGNSSGLCPSPTNGFWRDADWLGCTDGKWRPVEPGTFPLAHGATARVGRLRAYGNAINAQAAQAFIESAMSAA